MSRHRAVANLFDKKPKLPRDGFVAPSATVVGDVTLGERSSVWYGAVLRGDVNHIKVGGALPPVCTRLACTRRQRVLTRSLMHAALTNIQDQCIIHVAKNNVTGKARPTVIGDRVTVGHGAILHACTVEDGAFVGMGATIMDGAVVQTGAMVAAGALVTPGTTVPSGQIFGGSPAKLLRPMTADEKAFINRSAENYAQLAELHAAENGKTAEAIAADVAERKRAAEEISDNEFGPIVQRVGA